MKTTSLFLLLLFMAFSSIEAQLVNEKPNSNWPFLFTEFSECIIYHNDSNVSKVKANYNLLSQEIQFNKGEQIMSMTSPGDVMKVKFEGYTMVPFTDAFYIVLNDMNSDFVIYKKLRGNYSDITETKGAYGSSTSSSSVKQQSDINIGGVTSMAIRQLEKDKDSGKTFRVNEFFYFKTSGSDELQNLKKKTILEATKTNKKTVSRYIKENKIKFKKDEDVKQLGQFLNSL